MIANKGKKYRVINNANSVFNNGDIVIALEHDNVPWCVLESEFNGSFEVEAYSHGITDMMYIGFSNCGYQKDQIELMED